jgi:hypothetical protein
MLGNTKFHPSFIEDEIYEMMDDYAIGSDTFGEALISATSKFFVERHPEVEWHLGCSVWPDYTGGTCFVSWIENGHLHMLGFDYRI